MAAKVKSEKKPDPMVDHLAIPQGINKRVDLPPEAYFVSLFTELLGHVR
jgi:hypothetical protein